MLELLAAPAADVVALGGGAVALRARPRRAREPHRRLARGRRSRRRGQRVAGGAVARWRATATPSRRCYAERAAALRGGRRRVLPHAAARRRARARCERCAARPPASGCCGRSALGATRSGSAACAGASLAVDGRAFVRHRRARRRRYASARPGALRDPGRARSTRRSRPPRRCGARWSRAGVTRAGHVVALGGGVVGDLAGFCAATYQRGMPVVQVPTTLVAQVDSAYGGKTGVDLPRGEELRRRLPPAAGGASSIPSTLATLPAGRARRGLRRGRQDGADRRRRRCGSASRDGAGRRRATSCSHCARTKLAVVAADERDGGRRQVLNLGHTVGHAIETVTGYAPLPPRRGRRARPARRAAAVGRRGAARRGRGAAARARAADDARSDVDVEAVVAATASRQEAARRRRVAVRARRRAGRRQPRRRRSTTPACVPPSASCWPACKALGREQPHRGHARRQPRPARPARRPRTTAGSRFDRARAPDRRLRARARPRARASSRPTTRASSSSICTGSARWPTGSSSIPAPGRTTPGRSATRWRSRRCRRSRSTCPTSRTARTWRRVSVIRELCVATVSGRGHRGLPRCAAADQARSSSDERTAATRSSPRSSERELDAPARQLAGQRSLADRLHGLQRRSRSSAATACAAS